MNKETLVAIPVLLRVQGDKLGVVAMLAFLFIMCSIQNHHLFSLSCSGCSTLDLGVCSWLMGDEGYPVMFTKTGELTDG